MPSCSPFWYTVDTMQALHGYDYHAFELFGPVHLFWLGLCAFLCAGGSVLFRRLGPAGRQRVLRVLTLLLLADELLKDASSLATGQFVWAFLPFHLCSINLFICVWYALRPHPLAAEVLYALCLPGAAAALLFPSWQALPLWNVMYLHSSTVHTMLVLFPVLLLAGCFRPDVRRLPKVCAVFGLDLLAAALVNHLCGTNLRLLRQRRPRPDRAGLWHRPGLPGRTGPDRLRRLGGAVRAVGPRRPAEKRKTIDLKNGPFCCMRTAEGAVSRLKPPRGGAPAGRRGYIYGRRVGFDQNNAGASLYSRPPQRDPIFRDAKVLLFWCDQQQKTGASFLFAVTVRGEYQASQLFSPAGLLYQSRMVRSGPL